MPSPSHTLGSAGGLGGDRGSGRENRLCLCLSVCVGDAVGMGWGAVLGAHTRQGQGTGGEGISWGPSATPGSTLGL